MNKQVRMYIYIYICVCVIHVFIYLSIYMYVHTNLQIFLCRICSSLPLLIWDLLTSVYMYV